MKVFNRLFSVFFLVFFFSNFLTAQVPKPFEFTGIVKVDNVAADILYRRANFFIAKNYNNSDKVIKLNDPIEKIIVIKGNLPVVVKDDKYGLIDFGSVSFENIIQCKDGKYRYYLTDFTHEFEYNNHNLSLFSLDKDSSINTSSGSRFDEVKLYTQQQVNLYLSSLESYMNAKSIFQTNW